MYLRANLLPPGVFNCLHTDSLLSLRLSVYAAVLSHVEVQQDAAAFLLSGFNNNPEQCFDHFIFGII